MYHYFLIWAVLTTPLDAQISRFRDFCANDDRYTNHRITLPLTHVCRVTIACTVFQQLQYYHNIIIVGPPPPLITVDIISHPMSLPQLYLTITGEPLWPDYVISEFRVNITNTISGSLLGQMIITKNSFTNDTVRVQINESLLMFTVSQHYSLMISVSAVSPVYNESKPNQTSIVLIGSKFNSQLLQPCPCSNFINIVQKVYASRAYIQYTSVVQEND